MVRKSSEARTGLKTCKRIKITKPKKILKGI